MIDVKRLRLQFEIRITICTKAYETKHVLKSVMIRNMSKSQSNRLTFENFKYHTNSQICSFSTKKDFQIMSAI